MENVDFKELSEKLLLILDYEDGWSGRPNDICEELMNRWGTFYDVEIYHGASNITYDELRLNYDGFVSCSRDIDIAKDFATRYVSDDPEHVLLKLSGRIYALDVAKLIALCLDHEPNSPICEFIYEDYYNENEMLIYAEDMFSPAIKLEVLSAV